VFKKRGWRYLCSEELDDLQTSPNIIQGVQEKRMRWTRHVKSSVPPAK